MAITNHERVGKGLELLKAGLGPFVERELKAKHGDGWAFEVRDVLSDTRLGAGNTESLNDVAALLVVMDRKWNDVFRQILGKTERSLVSEILAVRNRWAHQEPFSSDDAYRALDSAGRLLAAISASQADDIDKMKMELLRVRFDEQGRGEKRKSAGIAIDPRVQSELTRYLSDNWVPVIEKDVDGPSSLPLRMDSELPNLGKFSACRRVARTIYLGSAPITAAAHKGIEDRRVKLGCVMPGESPAVFGDALRRMAGAATYLYQDGPHYWYSTQPTVTKLAEDRAEQLKREPDKVVGEIETRLSEHLKQKGEFSRIHEFAQHGSDVTDDLDARLVVLGAHHPYSKEGDSPAELAARTILETRGSAPRLYRNTLVFLAADKTRLQDLDQAARKYLAWESILAEKDRLDLSPFQVKQAETQKAAADGAVTARLPETYQWLLVPVQTTPQAAIGWEALRLSGQDPLAVRASKKLRADELLLTSFAPTRLRMELDRIPLWRGDRVAVKQLVEDFACYLYLPRLREPSVLLDAIADGVALMFWEQDAFAFADSFIAHLAGLVDSSVTVTLDVQAEVPDGFPDQIVRTVTENGRTLKFTSQGFEKE